MLLRVSIAILLFSVALAAVVPVVVSLASPGEEQSASQVASVEPVEPEAAAQQEDNLKPSEHLRRVKTHSKQRTQRKPPPPTSPAPSPPAPSPPAPAPPAPTPLAPSASQTLPVAPQNWPQPSGQEVAATQAPRYYSPPRDSALSLTVGAIGLYDVPVINSSDPAALDRGVIHFPQTPMPWEQRPQKNVYLAGHRLGWPGTGSRLVFYNLNRLTKGNSIVLKDGAGDTYEYRVSEVFVVTPDADWAMEPVRGRDMLTLQTCTIPDLKNRIIVRADRV